MVMLGARLFPSSWLAGMAQNPLVNGVSEYLYLAVMGHFAVGLTLAGIYAMFWEPKMQGSDLSKGLTFALIPWALSVTVFFPLTGAGFLGYALEAGPLPALGNLVLHMCYGALLGICYGPVGERWGMKPNESQKEQADRAARGGALGLLGGVSLGAAFALGMTFVVGPAALHLAALPLSWFYMTSLFTFCSLGLLVGLWTGATPRVIKIPMLS